MTGGRLPTRARSAAAARRRLTDPLLPVLLLAAGAAVAASQASALTWAVLGGLAGYSLSGSV
jgi:uncharacterized protein (DUF697 family)